MVFEKRTKGREYQFSNQISIAKLNGWQIDYFGYWKIGKKNNVTWRSEALGAGLAVRDVCLKISRAFCAVWSLIGLKSLFDLQVIIHRS